MTPEQKRAVKRIERSAKQTVEVIEEPKPLPGYRPQPGDIVVQTTTGRYILDSRGETALMLPRYPI